MIFVDDRIGSADLIGHLRHWSVPCEMERLTFGDACFVGNGRNGQSSIGVEVKTYHDALTCMGDGRFAGHQLPGLLSTYDRVWLVIEGEYRVDFDTGILLGHGQKRREVSHGPRRFMYRELCNWLTTMEVMAGVHVRRTGNRIETAKFLADVHGWWQKEFADHKSHLAIHTQGPGTGDAALFTKASLPRMVAAQLPGIGWKKSQAVVKKFGTVAKMVVADQVEWTEIEGIGEVLAERIWTALRK